MAARQGLDLRPSDVDAAPCSWASGLGRQAMGTLFVDMR
jgi:hypothetical protein